MFKSIFLGIRDYCRDVYHDWLNRRALAIGSRVYDKGDCDGVPIWFVAIDWKEGSVWHYIRQRKIGNKVKKEKKCVK